MESEFFTGVTVQLLERWIVNPWPVDQGYRPAVPLEALAEFANKPIAEVYERCKNHPAFQEIFGTRDYSMLKSNEIYLQVLLAGNYHPLKALESLLHAWESCTLQDKV